MGSDLHALISKLEKATEPNLELDHEIFWATSEWVNKGGGYRRHKVTGAVERFNYHEPEPRYTSSIDTALTLHDEQAYAALLDALAVAARYFANLRDSGGHIRRRLPIFLCIAALKEKIDDGK